jgi:signal transduction histidine kinase
MAANEPIRILLVEDSELDAELVLDELLHDGMAISSQRVDSEPSFVAALEQFAPDLIVSDLSMPDFSGYRALEIAKGLRPRTPFLFVSGTMGEEAAVEALRGGATDYVLKHNLARLRPAVRRALTEAAEREARARAEEDLLRVQRYESLALLASGLSHDLRNVLQPISMGAAMLADDPREEVRKSARLIADCTQRGLDIVASLLSFARGSRAALGRVRVGALLDGLALLLRGTVPHTVSLRIVVPETPIEIDGNDTELQQCLLNLCLNALQAMPDGGELRLEAALAELDAAFFESGEPRVPGRYLKITVTDSGTGMSEDVRSNLFKPFFTTKERGTGLGLLSCRRIVANHRGYMRIASEVGKGTTFGLYLPLPHRGLQALAADARPVGRGELVLVVIEEASTLSLLKDTLESHAYRVSAAQNGAVALQSIRSEGLPDVVVMEAKLNLMTGVRTATALIEQNFRGPVIMIARGASISREDLPPLQRIRFVDKPVNPAELLRVLAEELGFDDAAGRSA